MPQYEDYEIPKDWPPSDIVQWLSATLEEDGVTSLEIFKASGKFWVRVHRA